VGSDSEFNGHCQLTRRIAVILKGYPRLSETFIAQELLGLERAGLALHLFSMRHPTDRQVHPVHGEIAAPVTYLPEYLHHDPGRVVRAWRRVRRLPGYRAARARFLADLRHDFTGHRMRRWGQALVLAAELPADISLLYAHFVHTPASVTHYASLITGLPWTCSAHAKDIWTTSAEELRRKLASALWTVTCTKAGHQRLSGLSPVPERVHFSHHGLDLARFAKPPLARAPKDGRGEPVEIVSVCRAVEKKGLDVLLQALALLPRDLNWRFTHVGGGELVSRLRAQGQALGLAERIRWRGALAQTDVLELYRTSDLFVLACRIASDGDRDGLPNVLVEAQSQGLCCVSTTVSGVPELIDDAVNGLLVPPEDAQALADALARAIAAPDLRQVLGAAGEQRVRTAFDHHASIDQLVTLFASVADAASGAR
jgi:glycosyltransferase involved in cell wall biosynthesis